MTMPLNLEAVAFEAGARAALRDLPRSVPGEFAGRPALAEAWERGYEAAVEPRTRHGLRPGLDATIHAPTPDRAE